MRNRSQAAASANRRPAPRLVVAGLVAIVLLSACSGIRPAAPATGPAPQAVGAPAEPPKPAPEPPKPAPEPPKVAERTIPSSVRGIHVSGWVAGTADLIGPLLTWAKSAGLNTVVLDVKAEDGKLSWNSDVALAIEAGANARKIGDIAKLVEQMHEQGFWVVGRIVVMNDW